MTKNKAEFRLKLRGKTAVFVDWGNVYHWKDSLKKEINLKKLYQYLKTYRQIKTISFYYGTDTHPASKNQIKQAGKIGFLVVTKPVKYLPKKAESGEIVYVRKCDFDLEIGLDCFENLDKYDSFIIFSGDGDFATLYKRLIYRGKQVVVVFAQGYLGKEVRSVQRGIFLCVVKNFLAKIAKKYPPTGGRGHN